jgi:CRP-like cAMP-binding protein
MSGTRHTGDLADFAIDRLNSYYTLDDEARRLVERLVTLPVRYTPAKPLLEAYATRPLVMMIVSGWAVRTRDLPDGRRQIYSFLLPGDIAAFRASPRGWNNTTVAALTLVEAVDLTAHCRLEDASCLSQACTAALAAEQALIFDQVARLGQRDAYQRAVDLLLELYCRLSAAGLIHGQSFSLPITQDHLAEALGVTPVHVRRILQRMKSENMLALKTGHGFALDIKRLEEEHGRVCSA